MQFQKSADFGFSPWYVQRLHLSVCSSFTCPYAAASPVHVQQRHLAMSSTFTLPGEKFFLMPVLYKYAFRISLTA